MTVLLWMLPSLLQTVSVMCELPAPVNVTVEPSRNFVHLLTWKPGPRSPKDVYYNVTARSLAYGSSWEPVVGCERVVSPLECNVTAVFPGRYQTYYAQVRAVLGDQLSGPGTLEGFRPIQDTHLDPPLVIVNACGGGLCVGLRHPVEDLRDVYNSLKYTLSVRSRANGAEFPVETQSLGGETLPNLAPGREYCVKVRIAEGLTQRESAYGREQCAFTAAVLSSDTGISVFLCLLVVIPVVVVVLLVHTGFICLRTSLPEMLSSTEHHERTLVAVPSAETLLSSLHVEASPPPTGNNETGEESEDDADDHDESSSGGNGRGYEMSHPCEATPLSSSGSTSGSSSSGSAGVPPRPSPSIRPPPAHGAVPSDEAAPTVPETVRPHQPPPLSVHDLRTEPPPGAGPPPASAPGLNNSPSSTRAPSRAAPSPWGLWFDHDRRTGRRPVRAVGPAEAEMEGDDDDGGGGSGWDVSLRSVTLRGLATERDPGVEEAALGPGYPLHGGESAENAPPLLPSQAQGRPTEPGATHTAVEDEEVEEEEDEEDECECSSYLRR